MFVMFLLSILLLVNSKGLSMSQLFLNLGSSMLACGIALAAIFAFRYQYGLIESLLPRMLFYSFLLGIIYMISLRLFFKTQLKSFISNFPHAGKISKWLVL
jgi:hypothetical protein